jgi:hypothetical protein
MLQLRNTDLSTTFFATFMTGNRRRKDGKWQARIGRIGESRDTKDIYLGTFGECGY